MDGQEDMRAQSQPVLASNGQPEAELAAALREPVLPDDYPIYGDFPVAQTIMREIKTEARWIAEDEAQVAHIATFDPPTCLALTEELREAWRELHCCDDISLGKTLAIGIGELQSDREHLRSERDRLREALRLAREVVKEQVEDERFLERSVVGEWFPASDADEPPSAASLALAAIDAALQPQEGKDA